MKLCNLEFFYAVYLIKQPKSSSDDAFSTNMGRRNFYIITSKRVFIFTSNTQEWIISKIPSKDSMRYIIFVSLRYRIDLVTSIYQVVKVAHYNLHANYLPFLYSTPLLGRDLTLGWT